VPIVSSDQRVLSRRGFLQTAGVAAAQSDVNNTTAAPPNILFLMADQFRFDGLGRNGNPLVRTPHLDRLAAESANFANAFVQAPVCVPSRVSYFTGRYPHSHKNRVNYTPCDSREIFLQRMLKDSGYRTGCVGKLHFTPPTNEHARSTGFDRVLLHDGVGATDPYSDYLKWRREHDPQHAIPYTALAKNIPSGKNPFRGAIDYEFTPTHWTGEETCKMLREFAASPKPFFLLASFFKPHSPFDTQAPYDSLFDQVDFPLPKRVSLEDIRKLPPPLQKLILRNRTPEYTIDPQRLEWMYRSYYAAVAMVDYEIGRILEVLESSGRSKDTIVIFATDHGAQLLEHGLMDKNVFFESSVHVPFLFRYPTRVIPSRPQELIEMVDVMPTLLELCSIPRSKAVQGRSFATLISGSGSYQPRDAVFSENIIPEVITGGQLNMPFVPGEGVAGIRHPDAKMIRTARWKLNYYPGHGEELYDLADDPHEERNLAVESAHGAAVSELRHKILDWMITADENDQIAERWLAKRDLA
jgi:arylsulfatase